jgi:carbon-monoxide dehydrogenase large subunit
MVDYEDLPAAPRRRPRSRRGCAPQLHDGGHPGNVSFVFENGDSAAVESAFARAARPPTLRMHSQRLMGAPMENCALPGRLGRRPPASITVYTPTQGMLGMRGALTAITNFAGRPHRGDRAGRGRVVRHPQRRVP